MRVWLAGAAVNGFLSVAMGALAAHALGERLSPEALGWIEIAARYGALHGLALLAMAAMGTRTGGGRPAHLLTLAGWSFLGGSVLFCGSLYLMALGAGRMLSPLVPVGGVLFLFGWGLMGGYALLRRGTDAAGTDRCGQ